MHIDASFRNAKFICGCATVPEKMIGYWERLSIRFSDGTEDKTSYDRALADYTKAIELDPKSVVAYRYRAYLYDELGRGGAARDDCNGILELDPDNKDAAKALKRMGPDIRQMKVQ